MTRREPRLNSDTIAALSATHHISHAKAEKELGYAPRSIRESVHDAYRWFDGAHMLRVPLPPRPEVQT